MEEEIRILINCQHSFQIQLFKVICFPGVRNSVRKNVYNLIYLYAGL